MKNPFQTFERQIREEKSVIKELKDAYDIVADHLVKAEQRLREKDQIIATMNEAHKLLMAGKDALITELCDALEEEFGTLDHRPALKDKRPWSILKRARETTHAK